MDSFAVGLGVGIAIGFGGGFSAGLATGIASGRGKLQKQLDKAIADKEISIHDEKGEPLTIEALLTFLNENYKKA